MFMSTQTRFACPAAPDVCSGLDFAHLRSIWPMRLHRTHPSVVNIARSAAFDLCKSHVDTRLCLSGEPPMQAIGVILTIVTGGTIIHRHMTTNGLFRVLRRPLDWCHLTPKGTVFWHCHCVCKCCCLSSLYPIDVPCSRDSEHPCQLSA